MHEDGGRGRVLDGEPNRVPIRVHDTIEGHAAIRRVEIARRDEGEGPWTDRDVRPDHLHTPAADPGGPPDHALFHVRAGEAAAGGRLDRRAWRQAIPA